MLGFNISYLDLRDTTERVGNFTHKFNNLCECKLVPITTTNSVLTMTPTWCKPKGHVLIYQLFFVLTILDVTDMNVGVGKFLNLDIVAIYMRINIYTMHLVKFSCFPFDYPSQLVYISDLPYCHFDGLMYILGSPLPKGE